MYLNNSVESTNELKDRVFSLKEANLPPPIFGNFKLSIIMKVKETYSL